MKPQLYNLWRMPKLCTRQTFWLRCRISLTLLAFILAAITPVAAQTSSLSFNQIPYSDPDLVAPGRGVEHWFDNANFNNTSTVQVPAGNVRALDFYYRINWAQLEGATEGSYKWSLFDQLINSAIDNGQKFNFGILPMCEGYSPFGQVNGANLSYPTYIHNKMQAEATPDWIYSGDPCWVPNWNSEAYLSALENLYKAVANHIANGSYKGVQYKNVIGYIDVRGYGNFGEWHTYPWDDGRFTAPVNARATSATLKRIIDAHIKAFPNYQLVLNVAVWMQGASSYMPGDVGAYAANASNSYGKLGWRRDNWGQDFRDDEYYNSPYSYNGMRYDTVIRNRWKYAPIIGEPNTSTSSTPNYGDLPREIRLYHANSFGNGNYFGGSGISSQATKDSIIAASKACGYRLILEGGNMTTTLSGGLPFSISLNWKNVGVAPTYEHWNVTYELRNSSNVAVWTGNSSFQPYLFLPSASAQVVTDNFTLPANISPGTYSMVLVVRDPNGYRKPLPLAIKGRAADGSYLLRTVVVGTASSNQLPVANAGSNLSITLPLSSVTLNGSGTDADGSIKNYNWAQVSGPGGAVIASPNTASTLITGLSAGVFFFRLTVTDDLGATASDTIEVTVNSPANLPPVANAGSDVVITLPGNSTNLNGSASNDPDGSISSYQWTKISGPASFTLANSASAQTALSNLVQGIYVFRLTVKDNNGASASDDVTVTVNPDPNKAPVANAGSDISITLPTNNTTVDGSASNDPDGSISSYQWTKISGPATFTLANSTSAQTALSNLVQGTYVFRLTVKDNNGASASDDVTVTVNPDPNKAPVANAGSDISITLPTNNITLDGSASNDPDGSISTYQWTKISGPATFTLANSTSVQTALSNLVQGTYVFRLTVTDNNGASASDDVTVTVNGATNQQPVANAGSNISITLPTNSTNLNGSASNDPDGSISSYQWTKISGPASFSLANSAAAQTALSNLVQGTYVFRLTVTDNNGAIASDDVTITVNPAPNKAPVANAGSDIVITLPTNSTNLNGSASNDPDGSISSYQWTKISGPASFALANSSAVQTALSNLVQGTYVFRLTVTDNNGASSSDDVTITVNPAPNKAPVANAGSDIVITLPTNSTNLNGSASNDADGSISSYQWTKISGPASFALANNSAAQTALSNLVQGTYVFRLTVTDNKGAAASDDVTVTVNPVPNKAPEANAGPDQQLSLPVTAIKLDGSASYDPDGTITAYNWSRISGPGSITIVNSTTANASIVGVQEGTYVFEITVTDDKGAQAKDRVTVVITPGPNVIPKADAGKDTTIALPSSSVSLDGSQSVDPDGIITFYQWRQVSGPGQATIFNPMTSITAVGGLYPGEYVFELTVTDNRGGADKDSVLVSVVNNFRSEESLTIFPNPAISEINLRCVTDSLGLCQLNFYHMNGMLEKSVSFSKNQAFLQQQFQVSDLKAGMYLVEVLIAGKKRLTAKMIKQ